MVERLRKLVDEEERENKQVGSEAAESIYLLSRVEEHVREAMN